MVAHFFLIRYCCVCPRLWGEGNFWKNIMSSGSKINRLTGLPPLLSFSIASCVSGDLLKFREAILLTDSQLVISKDILIGVLKDT